MASQPEAFPLTNSPFYQTMLSGMSLTEKELAYVQHFRKHGYVVVEDCIADEITARQIHNDCTAFENGYGENRVQDGWQRSAAIKSVAANKHILSILKLLYGRAAVPTYTLNFLRGTEQRTHSDVIHFSSLPSGFMCGVWTALEDVTVKQGPLHYYPGSHTLPEFDYYDLGIGEESVYPDSPHEGEQSWANPRTREKYSLYEDVVERLMKEHGFERHELSLKRGQALIWAANLFHGGSKILDELSTRKSQVTHYHFEGTIPYTPMFSNASLGDYFLQGIFDARTGEAFERTLNYMPVQMVPLSLPSRYRVMLKTKNVQNDIQAMLPQSYSLDLEYERAENARLRQTLEEITETRLWKTMEPIRALTKKIRNHR
jgi:ectoine hydroxylase-related dioxygenase (phytanoyl-CoA dioxygenase family)